MKDSREDMHPILKYRFTPKSNSKASLTTPSSLETKQLSDLMLKKEAIIQNKKTLIRMLLISRLMLLEMTQTVSLSFGETEFIAATTSPIVKM
jgi:hypothetical protein